MMVPLNRASKRLLVLAAAAIVTTLVIWGCGKSSAPLSPGSDATTVGVLDARNPAIQSAMRIQDRHTPDLMRLEGVVGTATGLDERGNPAIKVYTETALATGRLPLELEGLRVIQEVTGRIVAFKGPPGGGGGGGGGGTDPKAKQTPPIQLGTSGSPAGDIANGYCCGGTLGALVTKGGKQYIMSNSHVFAGDVVSGGNGTTSSLGDDIIQPGLIDVNCSAAGAQAVADLSSLSTLYPPNSTPNVDVAIAEVRSGMVRTDGSILDIGTLSASTVSASVNQSVKKMGRTTGLTRSSISGLNATISVGYSDECAGGSFTKTFTGQIVVKNRGSKFLNSGDSGSLMVEDVTTNPRAVGLLYAGSSTSAIAQPIGDVLGYLGASMVGN
jgi:hypothetical protein